MMAAVFTPPSSSGDSAIDALIAALRVGAAAVAGGIVLVALALFAIAAAGVGLLITLAALAFKLAPRRRARGPEMLEGRRTADGWVVEAGAR